TALPDATESLHGIVRGRVDDDPIVAAVIGRSDVEIPETREGNSFVESRYVRAQKPACSPVRVAGHSFGERRIHDAMGGAEIGIFRPGHAVVGADLNVSMTFVPGGRIVFHIEVIKGVVRINGD